MVTAIRIEQEDDPPEPQPPLDGESEGEANNMSDHDGYSQNLMDLSIQDDSSTGDEWSISSYVLNQDMEEAPDVLLEDVLLQDDLNMEDPIPQIEDDESSGSILEVGLIQEPHAENEAPRLPRNERVSMRYSSDADLHDIFSLEEHYNTKVIRADGNCGYEPNKDI